MAAGYSEIKNRHRNLDIAQSAQACDTFCITPTCFIAYEKSYFPLPLARGASNDEDTIACRRDSDSQWAHTALLFLLWRHVQNVIDRRCYRRKYNAAKTFTAFGATVRDEVELDKLTAELLNVVSETMQPLSVRL